LNVDALSTDLTIGMKMDSDPEFTVDEGEDMSAIAEEKLFSVIGSYSESIEEDSIDLHGGTSARRFCSC